MMGSAFYSYKNKQQGAATLLVTTLLLLVALVITLTSYKNVFFQIKRAQNEIEARQDHWELEGGLECVYTKIHIDRDISKLTTTPADTTNYLKNDCINSFKTTDITVTDLGGKHLLIEPQIEDGSSIVKIGKILDMSSSRSSGAIKTTADLYIEGTITLEPPDPGKEKEAGWECMGVRYKSDLKIFGTIDNKQFHSHQNPPSKDFNANSKKCLESHQTITPSDLKNDFYKDTQLSPFEEVFDRPVSDWIKVRDDPYYQFVVLDMSALVGKESDEDLSSFCGEQIEEQIEDGNNRIWVEGNCGIEGDILAEVTEASQETDGVLLMVHNGILSLKKTGSSVIKPFKGALFHFNQNNFTVNNSDWNDLDGQMTKELIKGHFSPISPVVYVQDGAFVFTGGQMFDIKNGSAYFRNGLNFNYNSDVLDSVFGVAPPRWLKGSWHDF